MKLGPISFLAYFLLTMYAVHPNVYNTYGTNFVEGNGGTSTSAQATSRANRPTVTSHPTVRSGGGSIVSKPSQTNTNSKPNHPVAIAYPNNNKDRSATAPQQLAIARVNQPANPTTITTTGASVPTQTPTPTPISTQAPTPTPPLVPSSSPLSAPSPSPSTVPAPLPQPSTSPEPSTTPPQPVAPAPAGSTNAYYVDSVDGKDTNSGTSTDAAWKTIAKVNSIVFKPGDHILFKRGGLWREKLKVTASGAEGNPIVYDAYGTGAAPIISGADTVTGWTHDSGNIYKAHVALSAAPTQLYVDGVFYDIARYPQNGYLIATADSSPGDTTSIIDADFNLPSSDVVGATVVTRAVHWFLSSTIASSFDAQSHKLSLSGNVYNSQVMRKGFGFFLTNMLWMLDTPGEWYYSTQTGDLYVWTAQGDDPTNHVVEVSNRLYGIECNGKNFVTVQNISIQNANNYDVFVYTAPGSIASGITLHNLNLQGGQMGIYTRDIGNSTFSGNTITNTVSDGLLVNGVRAGGAGLVTVSNNTISHAGVVGHSPHQTHASISLYGNMFDVSNNQISYSGYGGIVYYTTQITIRNNRIDHSCLFLDDCGGIHGWDKDNSSLPSVIDGNTISDSIGNSDGTPNNSTFAEGIYLDDLSHGYTVTNNTVTNADYGYYIHSGYNNVLKNNVAYASRQDGLHISEDGNGTIPAEIKGVVHDNVIMNNVFETFSSSASGGIAYRYTGSQFRNGQFGDTLGFGTFDYNTYCHPYLPFAITERIVGKSMINYTLADWQKYSGQDMHSTYSTSTPCVASAQAVNTISTPDVSNASSFDYQNMLGNVLNSLWWFITQY